MPHWWRPALILLLVVTGAAARTVSAPPSGPGDDGAMIYVVRRSWHVDVGFDKGEIAPPLRLVLHALPDATYVFFGFGDRGYLTADHRHAPNLLAALWPGKGLILVTGLRRPPADAFGADHVIRLRVSREASRRAQAFIRESLQGFDSAERDSAEPDSAEPAEPTTIAGPYEGSVYYGARPRYSALHTCNTWAAEVLASAGLPIRSSGVVLAGQLWRRVRSLARAERAISE
jgi:hypothetical protein